MRIAEWFDLGDAAFTLFVGVMLVSTTAIVLAGLIGLALNRRASTRHAAWLCALAVVLLSPVLAWTGRALPLPPIAWPRLVATVANRPEPESSTALASPAASPGQVGPRRGTTMEIPMEDVVSHGPPQAIWAESVAFYGTTVLIKPAAVEKPDQWPVIARLGVVAAWLLGVIGLLARLAWGFRGVVRLRRTARPFGFQTILPRVASALGVDVDRLPAIGVSDRTSQPLTLGVIRPSVLIPEALAASLSADALRDVLVHECAHALRRDTLIGLLQRFAAIFCWPNPLVHWMNRELESAREELCDNHVLRAADPADYAASLLAVAERRPFAADFDALLGLPMIARRGTLESRIAALIDPRRHVGTSMRRGAVAALSVLFLAAGAAAAAVRFGEAEQPPIAASSKPLDPTKTRIEGVVVDESGKPAADVLVRSWTNLGELPETRTGADGGFTLDLDPQWAVRLLASTADGSLQAFERQVGGYQPTEPLIKTRMVLKPARATTVRVADAHGAPVADASIIVHDEHAAFWQSRTDAKGEARLRVASDAAAWCLVASKAGVGLDYYEDENFWMTRKPGPLPETVDLVLDGARTVKVKAVDALNRPVPGVSLTLELIWKAGKREMAYLGGSPFTRVTTDRDGTADFDFIPGSLTMPPHFSLLATGPYVATVTEGDLKRPDETLIAHVRWNVPVSGRVFAADGQPAPGILVRAEGQGIPFGGGSISARTGADGSYHLAVPPDASYLIGVVDGQWVAPSQGGIVPREGTMIQNIDFRLASGTLVTGRVTNGLNHQPVAGENVTLVERGANVEHLTVRVHDGQTSQFGDKTETLRRSATTDADGRFAFRVGPGSFSLPKVRTHIDSAFFFKLLNDDSDSHDFQVKEEAEIVYDFRVVDRVGNKPFLVTVREAGPDGAPVPDARIAGSSANPEGGWLVAPHTGRADAQGRFRARNVSQTMYIFARSADGSRGGFGSIDSVDGEASISIEKGTTVGGRVLSPDGTPFPRAHLYAYLAGPADAGPDGPDPANRDGVQLVTTCDAQGRYTLAGLPVGTRLHLTQPPYAGMGLLQDLGSIDLMVKDLTPLSAPDLVFKPSKP